MQDIKLHPYGKERARLFPRWLHWKKQKYVGKGVVQYRHRTTSRFVCSLLPCLICGYERAYTLLERKLQTE